MSIPFLVKDIRPGENTSNPDILTLMGNTLYFTAMDAGNGYELWKSNGTAASTTLVKDINTGGGWSSPYNLTVIGNTLYFVADDGVSGYGLWKSNGTTHWHHPGQRHSPWCRQPFSS